MEVNPHLAVLINLYFPELRLIFAASSAFSLLAIFSDENFVPFVPLTGSKHGQARPETQARLTYPQALTVIFLSLSCARIPF